MQAFGEQLTPEEIASIITYERDAWGNGSKNKTAGNAIVVQPADITKQLG